MPTDDTFKELAAGAYGPLRQPFVLVARDAATYAALRTLVKDLPDESADFFKTHAVVAAFLGERRSGGYTVEITQTARGRLSIAEHAPPKDAIVTMALTAPFRVAALPVEPDDALDLTLAAAWQKNLRPYRLTEGELTVSGGFAGINDTTRLEGSLRVMRADALVTFLFDVRSTGGRRNGRLFDAATGRVEDGHVTLPRLDSFAISGAIESPIRAEGEFTNGEHELTLSLETVPAPHVADNFAARGHLSAAATAQAPAQPTDKDVPL